ncbi:hypothetical protein HK102_008281 [Quaeritorhiza haematococci]|nr:hypothetical protein HK102_008281 [Quaeritorhiza haematococci]
MSTSTQRTSTRSRNLAILALLLTSTTLVTAQDPPNTLEPSNPFPTASVPEVVDPTPTLGGPVPPTDAPVPTGGPAVPTNPVEPIPGVPANPQDPNAVAPTAGAPLDQGAQPTPISAPDAPGAGAPGAASAPVSGPARTGPAPTVPNGVITVPTLSTSPRPTSGSTSAQGTSNNATDASSHISTGAAVGIVVGVLLGIAIVIFAIWSWRGRKVQRRYSRFAPWSWADVRKSVVGTLGRMTGRRNNGGGGGGGFGVGTFSRGTARRGAEMAQQQQGYVQQQDMYGYDQQQQGMHGMHHQGGYAVEMPPNAYNGQGQYGAQQMQYGHPQYDSYYGGR